MDLIHKISLQTVWQLLGKAVTSLSMVVILGLITRAYGREGTGVFTLALTLLAFFYALADLGINAHLLPRMLQNDYLTWQKLLGLRLVWSLLLTAAAVLIVGLWPAEPVFKRAVVAGAGAITASAVFTSVNAIFQSRLRYDLSVWANAAGAVFALIVISLVIGNNLPVFQTVAGHAAGWLVTAAVSLWLVRKFIHPRPVVDLGFIIRTFQESWPVSLTLILNMVYFRVDAFLITYFKGFADTGVYNLAFQIFQSVLVLPTYIMNGYYPLLLNKLMTDRADFRKNIFRASLVMAGLAIVGTIATLILAPLVISILTGSAEFSGAVTSLQVLALGFPAFFVSAVLMWVFIALKRYRLMLIIYLIGLAVNIVLNYLFIPRYSYLAASAVTVGTEYLILLLQIIILEKIMKKENYR